jgi:GTP cyclohydrolase I
MRTNGSKNGHSNNGHDHNGHGNNGNGTNGHNNYERDVDLIDVPSVNGGQIVRGFQQLVGLEENTTHTPSFKEPYESTEIWTGDVEQYQRIEKAVFDLLDAFNVNWEDPNYTDTPKRVAKAYMEYWAHGYGQSPEEEITTFPNSSGSRDLVMVKDMKFYSLCSHHLAPFDGYGAIAYMPSEHLLGLSKLGRILEIYARRFQLQERIGAQTADAIMRLIQPQGVMVVLYDAEHMCMSSRGVKLHDANTTTIATRGVFQEDAQLRNEVLSLLKR